jgi:hypothetical protein
VAAVLGRLRHDRVGLHGDGRDPLVHEPALDDHVGAGQDVIAPVVLERMGDVRPGLGEQDRRVVLQRRLGTDDDRQRVETHDHRFRGVLRLGEGLGHDHRHGLTDVSDDVVREDRTRKRSPDVAGGRLRLQLQVGGRQRGDDARRPDGLRDIHRIHGACAIMERTNTARSPPSIDRLSTYRPRPDRNLGSSVRWTTLPKIELVIDRQL